MYSYIINVFLFWFVYWCFFVVTKKRSKMSELSSTLPLMYLLKDNGCYHDSVKILLKRIARTNQWLPFLILCQMYQLPYQQVTTRLNTHFEFDKQLSNKSKTKTKTRC